MNGKHLRDKYRIFARAMKTAHLDILMPTYNGERYIRVLLDSLFAQTYTNWHLYVRDDHSKDATVSIVQEYAEKHPRKVTLVEDGKGNLGVNKNFSALLGVSTAEYACFCDQDDQWMPDKLEVSVNAMQHLEKMQHGKPSLVYSNLRLVDGDLKLIHESLWEHDKLNPNYTDLSKLLVQNQINGNVMIMNKALVKLVYPVPDPALWFDHWVSLIAAAAGKIEYINRTTINYRLHGFNSSRGDNRVTKTDEEHQLKRKLSNENFNEYFGSLQSQAKAVKERLESRGEKNEKSIKLIDTFLSFRKQNALSRRWTFIKSGFFKHSAKGTLKWFLRI